MQDINNSLYLCDPSRWQSLSSARSRSFENFPPTLSSIVWLWYLHGNLFKLSNNEIRTAPLYGDDTGQKENQQWQRSRNKMTRLGLGGGEGGVATEKPSQAPPRRSERLPPHKVLPMPPLLPYLPAPRGWGAALPSSSCSLDELLWKSREKLLCQGAPALLRLLPPDISSDEWRRQLSPAWLDLGLREYSLSLFPRSPCVRGESLVPKFLVH